MLSLGTLMMALSGVSDSEAVARTLEAQPWKAYLL